jgi:decaprenylphospho-beta-D-ribofuranose 2-oxidase
MQNKKSIDGFFKGNVCISNLTRIHKKKFSRLNSVIGEGNSISGLPFIKKGVIQKLEKKNDFVLDKKKRFIIVNANARIVDVHNFLLKNKFFCHYFPSYPYVTVGGCIANGSHGIAPKLGIFTDFVEEITIYNPNFGYKKLSKIKNKNIFELTKSGLGMTGVILNAKLKIFELPSTNIKIENYEFNNLLDCYKFMKQSKQIYNQNSFTINYSKEKIFLGRLISGSFDKKEFFIKNIKNIKISKIRIGLFNFFFIKNLIFNLIFLLERLKIYFRKNQHINDILFTSNKRTLYFSLMPNKFIEYQNIIPDKKVKKYLKEFEKIIKLHKPNITLLHLKQFAKNNKNLAFTANGLAIAVHIIKDKNFEIFLKKLIELDLKFKCKLNLYKNSLVDKLLIEKFYRKKYIIFLNKIKKINKKYLFTNNIFVNYLN